MTTLTRAPLAPLLERLFAEADATAFPPALAALSREESDRLMRSQTGYRDFYAPRKDVPRPVSRESGALLYMLARGCGARTTNNASCRRRRPRASSASRRTS